MLIFSLAVLGICILFGCGGAPTQTYMQPQAQQISPIQAMSTKNMNEKMINLQSQMMQQMSQAAVTAPKDYMVGPEDLLEVNFYGQKELGRTVRVNGNGEITLALVGPVKVSGLSPQEIENRLMELYKEKKFIKDPQLTVFVKEYRHQKVMVSGAVEKPGSYEVIGPRTLLEMIGLAGGLNEKAGNSVYVIRSQTYSDVSKAKKGVSASSKPSNSNSETIEIDLNHMVTKGAMEFNIPIKNGDVIHVPFANSAFVMGAVNRAGNVPLKNELTVTQAIAMAGGTNDMLASDQVLVIRTDEKGQRVRIPLKLSQMAAGEDVDIRLKENDIVYVQESGFRRFLYNFRVLNPLPIGAAFPAW